MRITLESDYALRIVCELAKIGGITDSNSLSEKTSVPLRFTQKILRKLLTADMVESVQGPHGGYRLKADPDTLTMRHVIEWIDGPIAISRCLTDTEACNRSDRDRTACALHHIFEQISREVTERFDAITVADLVSDRTFG